ncbi:MAG: phosphatase PAP2 family protein [Woeseiaceae bacterium]
MAHLKIRLLIAPFLVFGGLWLHELIQVQAESPILVDNALERAIPFLPWTIWIYFSFFVFIGSTVFRVEDRLFWQFIISSSLAACIAWSIVLLFPVTFDRPDPAMIDSDLYRQIYTFVHEADPSHITFPSLHVAVTWICNFLLWNRSGRWLRIALGVAISLSTLFTKQHLVSDVFGGVALAWFCVWLVSFVSAKLYTQPDQNQ